MNTVATYLLERQQQITPHTPVMMATMMTKLTITTYRMLHSGTKNKKTSHTVLKTFAPVWSPLCSCSLVFECVLCFVLSYLFGCALIISTAGNHTI